MNIKNTLLAMCLCGISMLPLEAQQVWTPDVGRLARPGCNPRGR